MKCEYCGHDLRISKSYMESPEGTITVTCVQKLVCTNVDCELYCGNDATNPIQVAKTIRTDMEQGV